MRAMRKYSIVVPLLLVFVMGCSPSRPDGEVLAKINNYYLYRDDFLDEVQALSDFQRAGKTREDLLNEIIQKKLLLQEAQREGLDKEAPFMKMIERFWEQCLLRAVIEKRMDEYLGPAPTVSRRERDMADKKFEEWSEAVRQKAHIHVNKEMLENIVLPGDDDEKGTAR